MPPAAAITADAPGAAEGAEGAGEADFIVEVTPAPAHLLDGSAAAEQHRQSARARAAPARGISAAPSQDGVLAPGASAAGPSMAQPGAPDLALPVAPAAQLAAGAPDLALPVAPAAQLAAVAALRREVAAKRGAMRGSGAAAADFAAADAAAERAARERRRCPGLRSNGCAAPYSADFTVAALRYRAGQKAIVEAVMGALAAHAGRVAVEAARVAAQVWPPAADQELYPMRHTGAAAEDAGAGSWDADLRRLRVTCSGVREIAPPRCAAPPARM